MRSKNWTTCRAALLWQDVVVPRETQGSDKEVVTRSGSKIRWEEMPSLGLGSWAEGKCTFVEH